MKENQRLKIDLLIKLTPINYKTLKTIISKFSNRNNLLAIKCQARLPAHALKDFRIDGAELKKEISRRTLPAFVDYLNPEIDMSQFHETYYSILDRFAKGEIKKLIVSVPPQHGKSLGASNYLPAYILGIKPEWRVTIASYSFSLARRFGQGVQRIIESEEYQKLFPSTKLKGMAGTSREDRASRTSDEVDIVGHSGGLRLVGREGSLTGSRVDVMILDDMYKDAQEANSPLIRDNVWQWYCSVVKTRLHNNSQELIVFTRWHEEDLIGKLLEVEPQQWEVYNFPALKIGEPTPLDPRSAGEPLWSKRHSRELLLQKQLIDPVAFESLYQGNPKPQKGQLYTHFNTYKAIEGRVVKKAAYIDTADRGKDYLCAIAYTVVKSGEIYVEDLVYSSEAMEVTENLCSEMLQRCATQVCYVESNNGGRGFARVLASRVAGCRVESFHQSDNKISRILSNSTQVMRQIYFPENWQLNWAEFSKDLFALRRELYGGERDDAADALTGVVERESQGGRISKVSFFG